MEYKETKHARRVISRRKISRSWLKQVLLEPELVHPDEEDPDLEHRLAKIKEFGNRVLRVIVNTTVKPNKIITAYFDRTMKGKL